MAEGRFGDVRCLVTGGAGFIGSHLTEHLLALGNEVVVLDDLSTGSRSNLRSVLSHPRLRLVHGDIRSVGTVHRSMAGVQAVFHLAAAVGVFTILGRTLESLRTNLVGTENVLDAACRHGVPLLLASSSEVYGKNPTEGLREDDDRILGSPLTYRWSYSEAKALDETLTALYAARHGLPMVIVRLFNTAGPRQSGRYGMVIPRFVGQALADEPLTVFGDGRQIRCFCHVADVVPALVALLGNEQAHGGVYNLGSSEPVTIEALARQVIAATGSASTVVTIPYEQAYGPGHEDLPQRIPNCDRIRRTIGFRPARALREIVDDVAAELRNGHRSG